jgi:PAS domain S-box-containing protein
MERVTIIAGKSNPFVNHHKSTDVYTVESILLSHGIPYADLGDLVLFFDVDMDHPSLSIPHGNKHYVFSKEQPVVRDTLNAMELLKKKGIKSFLLEENISQSKLAGLLKNTAETSVDIERQHALVLDSMGDALVLLDEKARIVLVNKAAYKLMGLKARQEIPSIAEFFRMRNEGVAIDIMKFLERAKTTGQPIGLKAGTVLVLQDGSERYISANIAPILSDRNRRFKGFIIIFRDISRVVNAEMRIKLFSNIIRTSSNFIVIIDKQLSIIYTNEQFDQAFKKSEKVLFAQTIASIPELKAIDFESIVLQIEAQSQVSRELSIEINGQSRMFLMQAALHQTNGEATVYNFNFIDIHEQKSVESILAHERRVFQDVFDHSPIGIAILDRNYRIVQTNESFSEMFQISLQNNGVQDFGSLIECRGKNKMQLCGESQNCINCMMNTMIRQIIQDRRKVLGNEFTIRRNSGKKSVEVSVRMSGVPVEQDNEVRALLLFEDITQTKEFEKILIRNERQLRVITDNMQEAIAYLSSDGTILYASPSHEKLIGFKPEELVGTNFYDYIHENQHHETKEQLYRRIQRKSIYSTELSLKRRDQTSVWVETTGSLLINDDLSESMILVSRDISIKHKTLEEMQRVKELAIAANRAKSEFLANMSHEIRTPMNGIIGMTNLTLLTNLDGNQRENLLMVRSSAESLLKIINSILDFSKIEAGKITIEAVEFQLDALLNRMNKTFHLQASQKNIEFRIVSHCNTDSYILGDLNRLTQVLNNLIGNAIKFTDAGYIELKVTEMHQTFNEMDLLFEVVDTGVGIEYQYQHRIFESFSQADGSITRRFGGTGLGLSITKQLVELMGGSINFESVAHKGSRFYFSMKFKRVLKDFVKPVVAMEGIPEAVYRGRVLLVEDDKINQILAKRLLDKQGHEVTIADNGQIAVEMVGKMLYDLILMDIQMPVMDGMEATKRIRTIPGYEDVPIIALTAYAIKGDRDRFLAMGMDEYISKPIDMERFYKVVNHLLRKRVKEEHHETVEILKHMTTRLEWEAFQLEFKQYYENAVSAAGRSAFENIERQAHFIKTLCISIDDEEMKRKAIKLELAARKELDEEIQLALDALKELYEEKCKERIGGEQ